MSDVVLALDVGGTKALGGLVSGDGTLLHVHELPTGGTPGMIDPELATVRRLVRDLLDAAHDRELTTAAIGAGFPEYVGAGLLRSREVLDWHEQPGILLGRMVDRDVAVTVESDVRCGALAEAHLGVGAGKQTVAYVSWGTGLSWTLVQAGAALAGRRGEAIGFGELGVSLRVAPDWTGNLEQFASGKGIATRYSALTISFVAETREVVSRAAGGDARAALVLDSAAHAMGEAISWMVSLIDPDLVVLGGGIGVSDSALRRKTVEHYASAPSTRPEPPAVVSGALGKYSGLLGAAVATGFVRP